MKAPQHLRKLASKIHGRRQTYAVGFNPPVRTVCINDNGTMRLATYRSSQFFYPANSQ